MKAKTLVPPPVRRGLRALQNEHLPRWGKGCLAVVYGNKPVPLGTLFSLRGIAQPDNALVPELSTVKKPGSALRDPFLAEKLADIQLGEWTLSVASLNFVERQIEKLKPTVVLEFGSGISTVCISHYMRKVHGDAGRLFVYSVEQNPQFAQKAVELLTSLGLDKYAKVMHAPVTPQTIEGKQTTCYDLSANFIPSVPRDLRFDFVMIDGPAGDPGRARVPGDPGVRFGTLPLTHHYIKPGSSFLLDDGLRDLEMGVAREWSKLPYLQVDGIRLVGRGLVSGKVR